MICPASARAVRRMRILPLFKGRAMSRSLLSNLLGLVGAAVGGAIGYFAFRWFCKQGFYAMVLPGGMLGLGCLILARHRSMARGIVCGVAAVALGLFTEWRHFWANRTLGQFLTEV